MSAEDRSPATDTPDWVPSPEEPSPGAGSPTTTEFDALVDAGEAVPRERTGEQIGASAGPAVEAPPVVEGEHAHEDGVGDRSAAGPLGGLLPPDRPELVVAVALAGGVLAAILLRSLARR